MAKIFAEKDLSEDQLKLIQNWGTMNTKVADFAKKSKLSTFQFLFGEKEGERLMRHYRQDCDSNILKFKTYLIGWQNNILLINILLNDELYIQ